MVGFRDKMSFRGKRHQFSGGHKEMKIIRNFRRFRWTLICYGFWFLLLLSSSISNHEIICQPIVTYYIMHTCILFKRKKPLAFYLLLLQLLLFWQNFSPRCARTVNSASVISVQRLGVQWMGDDLTTRTPIPS